MFKRCLHFFNHFVIPLTLVLFVSFLGVKSTIPNEKEVALQPFSSRAQNGEGAIFVMNSTNDIWNYVVFVKNNATQEWKKQTLIISADRMTAMQVTFPKSTKDEGFSIYPVMAYKIKKPA